MQGMRRSGFANYQEMFRSSPATMCLLANSSRVCVSGRYRRRHPTRASGPASRHYPRSAGCGQRHHGEFQGLRSPAGRRPARAREALRGSTGTRSDILESYFAVSSSTKHVWKDITREDRPAGRRDTMKGPLVWQQTGEKADQTEQPCESPFPPICVLLGSSSAVCAAAADGHSFPLRTRLTASRIVV